MVTTGILHIIGSDYGVLPRTMDSAWIILTVHYNLSYCDISHQTVHQVTCASALLQCRLLMSGAEGIDGGGDSKPNHRLRAQRQHQTK